MTTSSTLHILAIETSGVLCDVALVRSRSNDVDLLAQIRIHLRNAHSEKLIELIEDVLYLARVDKEQLNGVAVSIGPGSFTGLRIGLSAAKGLCFGLDIPLVGVPTLDALALRFHRPARPTVVAIGARKGECYFAEYRNGQLTVPYKVLSTSELGMHMHEDTIVITDRKDDLVNALPGRIGDGLEIHTGELAMPDAVVIGRMGYDRIRREEHDPADRLVPLYVQSFKGVMG